MTIGSKNRTTASFWRESFSARSSFTGPADVSVSADGIVVHAVRSKTMHIRAAFIICLDGVRGILFLADYGYPPGLITVAFDIDRDQAGRWFPSAQPLRPFDDHDCPRIVQYLI